MSNQTDELKQEYGLTDVNTISQPNDYTIQTTRGGMVYCYQITNPDKHTLSSETWGSIDQVPKPQWYVDMQNAKNASGSSSEQDNGGLAAFWKEFGTFRLAKFLLSLITWLIVFLIVYTKMMRNLAAQNMMNDTSDINQYHNDQHIALPEEVMRKFDWFPDAGAHSSVQPSSMISHVALLNKGINPVQVSRRADKDILDEDGDVEYLKGEILRDDDGNA